MHKNRCLYQMPIGLSVVSQTESCIDSVQHQTLVTINR
nr:hypothetical protein [uncultured bacterium]